MNKIIMITILAGAMFVYSHAEENVRDNASVISSIEVVGLTRTRPFVVKNALEKFLGMDETAFDEKDIIAEIEDLMVVEPISAQLVRSESGLVLSVTVKEKWSIIPVPMVVSGRTGTTVGFGLLESNLFGTRDMALVGAVSGPFGWYATAVYNHAPRRNGLPGGMAIVVLGSQEREDTDKNETVHRRYTTNETRFLTGLNYSVTESFNASFLFTYADIVLEEKDDDIAPPQEGALRLCFNPSISWRRRTWDGYFLLSQSVSLMYNYYYAITGNSYHQPEFSFAYDHAIVPGFRAVIRGGGVWRSTEDPLNEGGQFSARVSILPRNFSARNLAGGSAGLEKHLYRANWGTLSAIASWQGVYYESPVFDDEFNHGPAVGVNFYLSRLALPAMGIVYSYNMDSDIYQIGLTLGMTF